MLTNMLIVLGVYVPPAVLSIALAYRAKGRSHAR